MPKIGKTMLADKALIMKRLPLLMGNYSYELFRTPRDEHGGEKWRFRYVSAHRRPGTIEVDVNYMYRTPFFGTSLMNSVPLGGYTAKKIPVVDLREIAAGKSVAMAARCASRDL